MTREKTMPDLSGARVLIVEDEFYLAAELKETLERAGGQVLGPCSRLDAVARELDRTVPDCAIVDINLGMGPSFDTAEKLQERGIPFVFLTGYDASSIPPQLGHVERFAKPVEMGSVLSAVRRIARVGNG